MFYNVTHIAQPPCRALTMAVRRITVTMTGTSLCRCTAVVMVKLTTVQMSIGQDGSATVSTRPACLAMTHPENANALRPTGRITLVRQLTVSATPAIQASTNAIHAHAVGPTRCTVVADATVGHSGSHLSLLALTAGIAKVSRVAKASPVLTNAVTGTRVDGEGQI